MTLLATPTINDQPVRATAVFPNSLNTALPATLTDGRFLIVLMNHRSKVYQAIATINCKAQMYNIQRFIKNGNTTGVSVKILPYWSAEHADKWTVEVLLDTTANRSLIEQTLRGWIAHTGKSFTQVPEDAVVVRALHTVTGWSYFYVAAKDDTVFISDKQRAAMKAAINTHNFFGKEASLRLLSDIDFARGLKKIYSCLLKDVEAKKNFTTVVVRHSAGVDAQTLCRNMNKDYRAVFTTIDNLNTVTLAVTKQESINAQHSAIVSAPAPTAPIAPALAPVAVQSPVEAPEEVGCYNAPEPGIAEALYKQKRDQVHKTYSQYITLLLHTTDLDLDNIAEVIEEMVNTSAAFAMALGGKITKRQVINAVVNAIVPDPCNDFVFFEVMGSCLKAIEQQIAS